MVDVLVYGSFEMLDAENGDVFAYRRSFHGESIMVVCNFRELSAEWNIPLGTRSPKDETVLISTHGEVHATSRSVSLRPFESFACTQSGVSSRL